MSRRLSQDDRINLAESACHLSWIAYSLFLNEQVHQVHHIEEAHTLALVNQGHAQSDAQMSSSNQTKADSLFATEPDISICYHSHSRCH